MRMLIAAFALIAVVTAPRADEKQLEKITEEAANASEKLVGVLKSINDKSTADSALSKLKQLGSQLRQCQQAAKLANSDVTKEQRKSIAEKYDERLEKSNKELQAETQRIESIPQAYAVVKDSTLFKMFDEDRQELAKAELSALTLASQAYKLKYGDYPDKLERLVKPPDGTPYIESKDSLIDPWGRPYEYDPKGKKNDGRKPDIWSLGPRHKDGEIIGNWLKR